MSLNKYDKVMKIQTEEINLHFVKVIVCGKLNGRAYRTGSLCSRVVPGRGYWSQIEHLLGRCVSFDGNCAVACDTGLLWRID